MATIQKPKIQYVGQFYIHGSEARKLETQRRKPKTRLPVAGLARSKKLSVEPVSLVGIVLAVVLMVAMVAGLFQLKSSWDAYQTMDEYLSSLNRQNAELSAQYREGYDLEEIRSKAVGLGLVPEEDVEAMTVYVTVPEPEKEETWIEYLVWFFKGLFA